MSIETAMPTGTEDTGHRQVGSRGLIPLTKWNDHFDWPPVGGLRHLRFYQNTNGFKNAFIECGGRVLIDPDEFWKAVRQGGGT